MTRSLTKYQWYVIIFQILLLANNINSKVFINEFIGGFMAIILLIEIKFFIRNKKYFQLMSTLGVISMGLFIVKGFYNNSTLAAYFFLFPVIVSIYKEKHIGYKVQRFLLILYFSFIITQLLRGVGFNDMLVNRSRNIVSFYFIIYTIFYYIEKYRYSFKLEVWPAFLCLIISLLAIGRSGILISALLLIGVFIYKIYQSGVLGRIKYLITSIIVSIISFLLFSTIITVFLFNSLERFTEKGFDSDQRDYIKGTYFKKMFESYENFIFSFPLDDRVFSLFHYNLHNSFLSLHYFLGFFGVIIIIILIKALFFTKGNYLYKFFLSLLLIRGSTDQVFFFNFNDILIFYLIYLLLEKKRY